MKHIGTNTRAVSNVLAYVITFVAATGIMITSVLSTTIIIDQKKTDAAELQAQNLVNQIVDALVETFTVTQSMPNAEYTRTLDVPLQLTGKDYYIDVTDTMVYVNTTDGSVSKQCANYNAENGILGNTNRIDSGGGKITFLYHPPVQTYNLDFSTGNSSVHSPVEAGYYMVTANSTSMDHSEVDSWKPPWYQSDEPYPYRIPIFIENPSSRNLTDIPVKIELTPSTFDYRHATVIFQNSSGVSIPGARLGNQGKSNLLFIFENISFNGVVTYHQAYYSVDYWNPNGTSIIYAMIESLPRFSNRTLFLYYGGLPTSWQSAYMYTFFDDLGVKFSWAKKFTCNTTTRIKAITLDEDNNIYILGTGYQLVAGEWDPDCPNGCQFGSMMDLFVKKFDDTGFEDTVYWNKTWTSPYDNNVWGVDDATSLARDSNGNVYVAGTYNQYTLGGFLLKFTRYGQEIMDGWHKKLTRPRENGGGLTDVDVDPNDNVYVYGHGSSQVNLSKYAPNGNLLWRQDTPDRDSLQGNALALYTNETDTYVYIIADRGAYVHVRKYDSSGNEILTGWHKNLTISGSVDITVDPSGNVYVVSHKIGIGAAMASFDKYGASRWQIDVPGVPAAIAYAPLDDCIYLAGCASTEINNKTSNNWMIRRYYATNGTENLRKFIDFNGGNDYPHDILVDLVGDFYVVGDGENVSKWKPSEPAIHYWDGYTKKFDCNGSEIALNFGSFNNQTWTITGYGTVLPFTDETGTYLNLTSDRSSPGTFLSSHDIIPYVKVPEATSGNVTSEDSMYIVEMKFRLTHGNGSMILLGQYNQTYNHSYYVTGNLTNSPNSFMIHKQISTYDSLRVKTEPVPPINNTWLLLRSYIYLNATTNNKTVPPYNWTATYIKSSLYDFDTHTPIRNGNISLYDIACNNINLNEIYPGGVDIDTSYKPYMGGKIGIGAGLQTLPEQRGHDNITVDWIRVAKSTLFPPRITLGSWESLHFTWAGNPQDLTSTNDPSDNPFTPGPVLSDFITGDNLSGTNFFSLTGLSKNTPYRITVTKGKANELVSPMTVTCKVLTHGGIELPLTTLHIPTTQAGEYKSASTSFIVPGTDYELRLYFISDTGDKWVVNSVRLEEDSQGIMVIAE